MCRCLSDTLLRVSMPLMPAPHASPGGHARSTPASHSARAAPSAPSQAGGRPRAVAASAQSADAAQHSFVDEGSRVSRVEEDYVRSVLAAANDGPAYWCAACVLT